MDISVDSKITVKIGEQEVVLSKDEAEKLYSGLYKTLNKGNGWHSPCWPYITDTPIVTCDNETWVTSDVTGAFNPSVSTNVCENNG